MVSRISAFEKSMKNEFSDDAVVPPMHTTVKPPGSARADSDKAKQEVFVLLDIISEHSDLEYPPK